MTVYAKNTMLRDKRTDFSKGMNTISSLNNYPEGYAPFILNGVLSETGAVIKRKGFAEDPFYQLVQPNTIVSNAFELRLSSGGLAYIFAWESPTGVGYEYWRPGSGFATSDSTSTILNERAVLVPTTDRVVLINCMSEIRTFVLDGSLAEDQLSLGIPPPESKMNVTANPAGSLTTGASYIWAYTFANDEYALESSPSILTDAYVVPGAGNNSVLLSNFDAAVPENATTLNIYRTVANGPVLFFEQSVPIGSTIAPGFTVVSDMPDAGLDSFQMEIGNTEATSYENTATGSRFKYGIFAQNRLFLTGLKLSPNRVHFSKIGALGPNIGGFPVTHIADCISTAGLTDVNIGMGQANETPIVIKKNSIGRLEQTGNFDTFSNIDGILFQYKEISRAIEPVSHWATCNVYEDLLVAAKDNFYITDGSTLTPIATQISPTIKAYNWTNPELYSAINDTLNKRVYISARSDSTSEVCDTMFVGDYKNYPEWSWTIFGPGSDKSTYPGMKHACFFEKTNDSGQKEIYFGNATNNGRIYRMNYGTLDDTAPAYFLFRSPPISFGMDEEEKVYRKDYLWLAGNNLTPVTINSLYNLSTAVIDSQSLLSVGESPDVWGDDWGTMLWSYGRTGGPTEYNHHYKAYYKQLEIISTTATQNLGILAITITAWPTNIR